MYQMPHRSLPATTTTGGILPFSIHSNLLLMIEVARVVLLILLFDDILRVCMFRTVDFSTSLLAARRGNLVTDGMVYTICTNVITLK